MVVGLFFPMSEVQMHPGNLPATGSKSWEPSLFSCSVMTQIMAHRVSDGTEGVTLWLSVTKMETFSDLPILDLISSLAPGLWLSLLAAMSRYLGFNKKEQGPNACLLSGLT